MCSAGKPSRGLKVAVSPREQQQCLGRGLSREMSPNGVAPLQGEPLTTYPGSSSWPRRSQGPATPGLGQRPDRLVT
jgi:hypothetical protein